jgi:hypothetical protein
MANRRSTVDMSGVFKGLERMIAAEEPIARAMGVGMGEAVRDEAKIRAPVLKPENVGTDNQQPYLLRDSIYLAFDKRARVLNKTAYKYGVSWNSKKAPHGHLAEFGHEMPYRYARTAAGLFYTPIPTTPTDGVFVAAQPFLGPAFDAKFSSLNGLATAAGAAKFRELFP